MRITFLIRSLDFGGAERQLLNLATGLSRRGHSVEVVTLYRGGALQNLLDGRGIRLRSLGKRGRWDVLPSLAQLVATLRAERPDVLHGYLTAGNLLAGGMSRLFPRLVTVWGLRASDMDLASYGAFIRATADIERRMSRLADRIIVNSESGRRHAIESGFPAQSLHVIANGIDTGYFDRDLPSGDMARKDWGASPDERLVGVVARLDPMKDHPTFLRAATLLRRELPNVRFVCVGDGPPDYRDSLRSLAKTLGLEDRVIWAGSTQDVAAAYNALDVFCSSSQWGEGFPNAVAEAMACGVRCVITDVGDSARIVGDTGAVVPPRDPERLAGALARALRDPEHDDDWSRRRARIVTEFSLERLVERTEALLEEAIAERRGSRQ